MGRIHEYIKMAMDNIRSNKGRTFLTMLGIIIGISSVIMIMTIGAGVKGTMNSDLGDIMGGQMAIYNDYYGTNVYAPLTQMDLEAIQQTDGVKAATPQIGASGTVTAYKDDFSLNITGGNEYLGEFNKLTMMEGRYFDKGEVDGAELVAVITDTDARKMFGTTDVTGLTVEATVEGRLADVTIIGVGKVKQASPLVSALMGDQGDTVTMYMPYTALEQFGYSPDSLDGVYLIPQDSGQEDAVGNAAVSAVNMNHPTADGTLLFTLEKASSSMDTIDNVLNYMTLFISVVAAISLLVGGIGIMNIMLVSVTERTKEIGIRKALGAKTTSIITQFLAESAIISGIGGIIGIVFGVLLALLVCTIMKVTPVIGIQTILMATLFSCGVGILFGVYPAKKAAKLSPIDALRKE